ncbi:MAG: glycine--tRNA ligase subunit beta [Deltaproteobacteria bacterium]|nr:glycine--tRNA ligase subunit beta [Deltaproteobacteria bacterium]
MRKELETSRLGFDGITALGTPRRLALIVKGLEDSQKDAVVETRGPQIKAAYDDAGKPTGALLGFARAQSVDPKDLKSIKTEKGEYVYAVKEIKGEHTSKILPGILNNALSRDFFPKSMRWGAHGVSFARPVHWILALFDGETVEFTWGHIKSSALTYGHRFLTAQGADKRPAPIKVEGASTYLSQLRAACVIADPEERKKIITEGLEKAGAEAGGEIIPDAALLEEVGYLCEYPVVLRGSFDGEFLALPCDVVINVMREHQRYFSVEDTNGALLPYFMTVANTRASDMDVVRKGNERVLRARLNDAKFYFEKDVKTRLVERVEALKGVVFQAKLGTSYEKVERFTELALFISSEAGFSKGMEPDERPSGFLTDSFNPACYDSSAVDPGLYSKFVVGRAAMLCKADLTSGMVGEFPKLQGTMGAIYAKRSNEVPEVAVAVYEHYLPVSSGGALPASVPGAIVSIADKLDTITGCFGVGLIPTGAQDPYALRRQALGIIAIILDKGFSLRLDALVDRAISLLKAKLTVAPSEVKDNVLEFFKERLNNQLLSTWFDMVDAVKRMKALESFKNHPACPSLVTAFKRVSNILKGVDSGGAEPEPSLFVEPEENALHGAWHEVAPVMEGYWKSGEYEKVFETLASIKDRIDVFFDKVMVMAEDERLRRNRLALLTCVLNLYSKTADLSRLSESRSLRVGIDAILEK